MLFIIGYLIFVLLFVTRRRPPGSRGTNTPGRVVRNGADDDDSAFSSVSGRGSDHEEFRLFGAHHGAYDGPGMTTDNW